MSIASVHIDKENVELIDSSLLLLIADNASHDKKIENHYPSFISNSESEKCGEEIFLFPKKKCTGRHGK